MKKEWVETAIPRQEFELPNVEYDLRQERLVELTGERILYTPMYYLAGIGGAVDICLVREGVRDRLLRAAKLPPIIIFNFAYEYVTKDYMADEISEEITKTLMSNPSALEAFDEKVKRDFVKSTISSLVGEEKMEAVYGSIEPYLVYQHNLRSEYDYSVDLRSYSAVQSDLWREFADSGLYYKVKEKYTCSRVLAEDPPQSRTYRIGFFVDLDELDAELNSQNFIFRESLSIRPCELQKLMRLTEEEKRNFVLKEMSLHLMLNGEPTQIVGCVINEKGIMVDLEAAGKMSGRNLKMELVFYMPQLRRNCEVLISIPEPTYSPKINLSFDENIMSARMYPFLNGDVSLLRECSRMPGEITIRMAGWVYPVKGVLFIVSELEKEAEARPA